MSRDEAPPFGRGETYYQGVSADIPAALADRGYRQLLGKTYVLEDRDPSRKNCRTERPVKVRVVYNGMAATNVLPKYLCTIDPTNPGKVTGYSIAANAPALPADEYLPAAGVLPGDAFLVIEDGPATMLTAATDVPTNDIVAGDPIVTQASGEADTHADSGRAAKADLATGTAAVASRIIGSAMSTPTGGTEVNEDVLVNVGHQS